MPGSFKPECFQAQLSYLSTFYIFTKHGFFQAQRGTPQCTEESPANFRTAPESPQQEGVDDPKHSTNYRTIQDCQQRQHLNYSKQNYRTVFSHNRSSFSKYSTNSGGSSPNVGDGTKPSHISIFSCIIILKIWLLFPTKRREILGYNILMVLL